MSEITREAAYARSLVDIATAEDALDAVSDELFQFSQALSANDELRETLTDAAVPVARRQQLVADLLGDSAHPVTEACIALILGSGRARLLPRIVDEMVKAKAAAVNREVAIVRSVTELTADQKQRLADSLEAATGTPVEVRVVIDESIMGGLVAQVGDTVIDGSVRRRLELLKAAV